MDILSRDHPELANDEYLQNTFVCYGTKPPTEPGSRPFQMSTRGEVRGRNESNGLNQTLLGNLSIIFIYQIWEDSYRLQFSNAFGLSDKDDLKADIFGDLRYIRQRIIHNQGKAISDIEKCRLLKWYKPQEAICISFDQFFEIINHIKNWFNNPPFIEKL
jgi:hypothetical protein